MESQIQATVVSVTSRLAKRKSDNQQFTLYDIKLSDGETYTTSKKDVAEQAHALTGQLSLATVKVEQNGQWTNRYLNGISGTMGGAAAPPAIPAQAQPALAPSAIPDTSAERDAQIHRQVAAKVAANLAQTPQEFWANVDDLIEFFRTGNKPASYVVAVQPAQAPAPDFIPAGTPAADDDIPF